MRQEAYEGNGVGVAALQRDKDQDQELPWVNMAVDRVDINGASGGSRAWVRHVVYRREDRLPQGSLRTTAS